MSKHANPDSIQCAADRKLVKQMLNGDAQAYQRFSEQYLPKLYNLVLSRLKDPELTEEALQLTLTAAARYLSSYRGEASLLTWLNQICRRETSRLLNSRARYQKLAVQFQDEQALYALIDGHQAPSTNNPDSQLAREQLSHLIRDILNQLPDNYAQALELKYIHEKASKEIARELNISDEAAQSLLARARRAFKSLCDESLLALMRQATEIAPEGVQQ